MSPLALEGVRVVDLTWAWAGPHCTELLADLGAETIKVVQPAAGRGTLSEGQVNRNKHSLALDLAAARGKEVFKELVKISDVVVNNFSLGVMDRLDLGYPVLREVKPDIIMASMPAFGNSGPLKHYYGFGVTMEHLCGMSWPTGYPEDGPQRSGVDHIDPATGAHTAAAILAALWRRKRTGRGQFIDLSHLQSSATLAAEALMEYAVNKRQLPRRGNRHSYMAPHGCYRCKGEDKWVTIAVSNEEEWRALCGVMGNAGLAEDERFGDALRRWENQAELDRLIGAWTVGQEHYEVTKQLQAVGVPAGAVLNIEELVKDPHLRERGFVVEVKDAADGESRSLLGVRWKMSKTQGYIRKPAPLSGEDAEHVLGGLLKMSKEEIAKLIEEKVVSTTGVRG